MSKKLTKNQTIKLATERGETASYSGKTKKFYFSKFADPVREAAVAVVDPSINKRTRKR
jgi:hypothetical protein